MQKLESIIQYKVILETRNLWSELKKYVDTYYILCYISFGVWNERVSLAIQVS